MGDLDVNNLPPEIEEALDTLTASFRKALIKVMDIKGVNPTHVLAKLNGSNRHPVLEAANQLVSSVSPPTNKAHRVLAKA